MVPDKKKIPLMDEDFIEGEPGEILTFFGEPCHEGEEEIKKCGCGRAFLTLNSEKRSSVGIVKELNQEDVRDSFEKAIFKTKTLNPFGKDIDLESAEMEGTVALLSAFSEITWEDLKELSRRLSKSYPGAIFGVKNYRTGSTLKYRRWANLQLQKEKG